MIFTKWLVPFHKLYSIKHGYNMYPFLSSTFMSSFYVATETIEYTKGPMEEGDSTDYGRCIIILAFDSMSGCMT